MEAVLLVLAIKLHQEIQVNALVVRLVALLAPIMLPAAAV